MVKNTQNKFPYSKPTYQSTTEDKDFNSDDYKVTQHINPIDGSVTTCYSFPLVGHERDINLPKWKDGSNDVSVFDGYPVKTKVGIKPLKGLIRRG